MNRELQALVDAPLANALSINLPAGKRPAPKSAKPVYEGDLATETLTSGQLRESREKAADAKLASVLDYFATTAVPFDRIADHTKLPIERVRAVMAARGRSS